MSFNDLFTWSSELNESIDRTYYCASMLNQHLTFFENMDNPDYMKIISNAVLFKKYKKLKHVITQILKDYLTSNPNYLGYDNIMTYDEIHGEICYLEKALKGETS